MLSKLKSLLSAARHTFHSIPSGRAGVGVLSGFVLSLLFLASCQENDEVWDPYNNWQSRNNAWYVQVSDSALSAIAKAKAQYGDAWEQNCEWRRYKTLYKAAGYDSKNLSDSICVHILKRGTREAGVTSPIYTDTVKVNYRLFLMPTQYEDVDGGLTTQSYVADESYYGSYVPATASPATFTVSTLVDGFSTALQYMVPGDEWLVYMPHDLGYGSTAKNNIPAYSTLAFHICLLEIKSKK